MDRKEFIERVASKVSAEPKEVEQVFQKFLDLTITSLRDGEKVFLSNFGTFNPKITKATKKFSPLLNREIEIPEKFTINFSPSARLAEEINSRYREEKPKVIKEAKEREIEKKITIMPPQSEEEFSEEEKISDEISKLEKEKTEVSADKKAGDEVSLTAELLDIFSNVDQEMKSAKGDEKTTEPTPEYQKQTELKEEVSEMPEMNLNEEKPKFTYGEDLTSPSTSGTYKASTPTSSTTDAPYMKSTKDSSGALWVTLIILLLGIIGVGIYWALSSDVTDTKKEPVVSSTKETSPPVIVEKQIPKSGKKEIIIAPEEFASLPSDTLVKQKQSILVEEPVTGKEQRETQKHEVEKSKVSITEQKPVVIVGEKQPSLTTLEKRKPVLRKQTYVSKPPKVSVTSSQGDYYIQVNSYSQKKFADAFARDLRNKGYRAFVESADVPNYGKVYRVKVGFYLDEDSASKDYHSLRLLLKKEDIYVDRR